MHRVALTILIAFSARAHATEEEDEAMNKLMETLVDGNQNSELVDMIAEKLVTKLLALPVANLPVMTAPMAHVTALSRPAPMSPIAQLADFNVLATPDLKPGANPGYDASKTPKIGFERDGVVNTRNQNANAVPVSGEEHWGVGVKLQKTNPYSNVAIPQAPPRPDTKPGVGLNKIDMTNKYMKRNAGTSEGYERAADYEKIQKSGQLGGVGLTARDDSLQGLGREPAGGVSIRLDEDENEEPDAMTVIAVGLLSAFVGSAVTYVLFHRFRPVSKTDLEAPILS